MFRYYFISSWRNLKKNKLVSTINILGLAIGLSTAVLAIIYARHELSYEESHEHADNIQMVYTYGDLGSIKKIPQSFSPVGPYLLENFPEIQSMARARRLEAIAFLDSIPLEVKDMIIADNSIFSILTFEWIHGKMPSGPQNVALSQKMAKKYFDQENPVGNTISTIIWGQKMDLLVTGVYENIPANSHFKASCVIPFSMADHLQWQVDEYHSADYKTYTLTHENTDLQSLNQKILTNYQLPVKIDDIKVGLVPIKRIHLHENIEENNKANLIMLLVGGILALLISCFNYINLNTILFSTRMREVGIKKSFGAGKVNIFLQFLTDTLLSALLGLGLSLVAIKIILPSFNQMLSRDIQMRLSLENVLLIVAILLITVIVAGVYPAFGSSHYKPLNLMNQSGGTSKFGKKRLSNALITLQFLVAVILLQFIVLISRQGNYMFRQDVAGYNSNDVIVMDGYSWGNLEVVKTELLKYPGIKHVSYSSSLPGTDMNMTNSWKEEDNKEMALRILCDEDYLDVFSIDMIEGRFIEEAFKGDRYDKVVINSLTATSLGYEDPVGKTLKLDGKEYQIIGVVNNYQAVPPIFEDMPMLISKASFNEKNLLIKVNPKQRAQAHAHVEQVLGRINPNKPVNIRYYSDIVEEQGKSYIATFTIFNIFTIIIIFNSMMGLFGLSFFVAERKNKEIGVRKVCGANISQLFWNLSKGFFIKLFIAMFISIPIIYMGGQGYLATFPRHIQIGPEIYLTGGAMAMLMLILASGWKLYEVANANPARILRYE